MIYSTTDFDLRKILEAAKQNKEDLKVATLKVRLTDLIKSGSELTHHQATGIIDSIFLENGKYGVASALVAMVSEFGKPT